MTTAPIADLPVQTESEAPKKSSAHLDFVVNPFLTDTPAEEVESIPPSEEENDPIPPETVGKAPEQTAETPPVTGKTTETGAEKGASRRQLATQLEASNAELVKLRQEGEAYSQKYKDAEAKQIELEKQIKARDDEFIQARTPAYRWEDDPEVAGPRRKIFETLTDRLVFIEKETADTFRKDLGDILNAYEGARGSGEVSLRGFKDKMIEHFGGDGEQLFQIVQAIYPDFSLSNERQKQNSEKHFERTASGYEARRRQFSEEFNRIGRLSPEQIQAAPNDINSIISAAIGGDEVVLKEVDTLAHGASLASAGLPPMPPNASPELVAKYREAEKNREKFLSNAYKQDVELRILASITKKLVDENRTLKARVTSAAAGNRPEVVATSGLSKEANSSTPKGGQYEEIMNPYLK